MTRKYIKLSPLLFLLIVLTAGCGKSSGGGNIIPPPAPGKALLQLPAKDAVCTTGTIVTDSTSAITFTWKAATHADSYDLAVKNLFTGITATQNTTALKLVVTLSRNTPYSWSIISRSKQSTDTGQSNTWKFYSSGPGAAAYAPFPAAITSPVFGASITATAGNVNLTWTGSDVDGDITGYDIYLGTQTNPAKIRNGVTDMFLNDVAVQTGKLYYWKVVTKDSKGNTSNSGIYQFSVK
jgi:hypothetical protein